MKKKKKKEKREKEKKRKREKKERKRHLKCGIKGVIQREMNQKDKRMS